MIADLEGQAREIDFEEFLDAITSKLGDKETKVYLGDNEGRHKQDIRLIRRRRHRLHQC